MEKLNVVIADDHPIVLLGVRELIERDERFRVVGEAVCSNELIDLLECQPFHLVITDFNMPTDSPYGDGLKLVGYLKRYFPTVQILVLTMISTPLILTRLSELGALGVIQKSQLQEEIQVALKGVAQGSPFQSAGPAPASVMESTSSLYERLVRLSPKEHEVLRLFAGKVSAILLGVRTEVPRLLVLKKYRRCASWKLTAVGAYWLTTLNANFSTSVIHKRNLNKMWFISVNITFAFRSHTT